MAAKKKKPVKWMKKAFSKNKGALHCQMGVPMGMTIPASMLKKAAGKGGSGFDSSTEARAERSSRSQEASVRSSSPLTAPGSSTSTIASSGRSPSSRSSRPGASSRRTRLRPPPPP